MMTAQAATHSGQLIAGCELERTDISVTLRASDVAFDVSRV
jgi:hypothetical protein